jgi:hypothetical protein
VGVEAGRSGGWGFVGFTRLHDSRDWRWTGGKGEGGEVRMTMSMEYQSAQHSRHPFNTQRSACLQRLHPFDIIVASYSISQDYQDSGLAHASSPSA